MNDDDDDVQALLDSASEHGGSGLYGLDV